MSARRKWPRIGDRVRLSSTCGPNARRRFGDKVGAVVHLNRADGEVGVRFGSSDSHSAATWFLPHELEAGQDPPPVAEAENAAVDP